ncbi:thioredoxin fold domain-containing protein [Pseudomonadota bacterium]
MFLKRLVLLSALLGAVVFSGDKTVSAAELVYFHSEACPVCDRWNEEVGTIYPKTEESQRLPLRKQSVHDDVPKDLAFVNAVGFTPTFVVIEDGHEVGRITGYVNDMFFWQHIEEMIVKVKAPTAGAAQSAKKASSCGDEAGTQTC